MLKQFDLNFNSDLKYDNIRHLKTRKLSKIMNGKQSPGDDTCDHYTVPLPKVEPFARVSDTLSNIFPCEVKAFCVTHK